MQGNTLGHSFFSNYLTKELEKRRIKNPRYSLRAFAKQLEIDSASLSRILTNKTVPSHKLSSHILTKLNASEKIKFSFLASVAVSKQIKKSKKLSSDFQQILQKSSQIKSLESDLFEVISEWYYYAILELTQTVDFDSSIESIAERLKLDRKEVERAVEKLLKLKLLHEDDGVLRKVDRVLTTSDKSKTSQAHRKRQKQILKKSLSALSEIPIDKRSHTGMTMAVDESKLMEAKKMISEFNHKMSEFLADGNTTAVYELSIGLFPLTVGDKKSG